MATQINLPFSWDQVDKLSDLNRLRLVVDSLPDAEIIAALGRLRKNGRNEYPVVPMWRSLIAGIVFGHKSIESLIRELKRNLPLLELCGFSSVPLCRKDRYRISPDGMVKIKKFRPRSPAPGSHNFSRFLANLIMLEENRGLG